ncbi:MAG: hypothetical protein ACOYOU_09245 [Kiritimatiellia bacterium]
MQDISPDMRDLLQLLLLHEVKFAVCGGFAVSYYGFIRTTLDLDLLVFPSAENAVRMMRVLAAFGFGGAGIPESLFARRGAVVTLGVQPNQIDLLTAISSEPEDEVFADLQFAELWDMKIPVVSRRALLRAKQEADRPKDRIDFEEITKLCKLEQGDNH